MVSDYKSKRRQFTDTHNHTDSNISLNSDKNPEYREVDNEKWYFATKNNKYFSNFSHHNFAILFFN